MRFALLFVSLTATSIQPAFAASEHFVVGRLECAVSPSEGAVLGSKQDAACVFFPSEQRASVRYTGLIDNFGLDIGEVNKAKIVWAVTAVSTQQTFNLEGTYRGVEAAAAVGVGGGAAILTGSTHGTFSLQPLAVRGREGLDVSVGITELHLRPAI